MTGSLGNLKGGMSYTSLYIVFVLTSLMLCNALVMLARMARQVKEPPADPEFEALIALKAQLETELSNKGEELDASEERYKKLEEKLQKTEDTLQQKLTEIQAMKTASQPS
jgi:cell division protein ZapA (FtsZ GTPase activity inhibitor)